MSCTGLVAARDPRDSEICVHSGFGLLVRLSNQDAFTKTMHSCDWTAAHHDAAHRILRLLCLLRLIVRGWPVPERLRRSVGRRMRIMPLGKLQRLIRQVRAILGQLLLRGLHLEDLVNPLHY